MNESDWAELLEQCKSYRILWEENFSFARHTTIGCGGRAKVAFYPQNAEQCAKLLSLMQEKCPYCFLGAGANSLPCDEDFNGAVIKFSKMQKIRRLGSFIYVGAGVTLGTLCRFARENSFSGFEPLTGIPATVGGAVVMNAGVREGHISDYLMGVVGVVRGKITFFSKDECLFSQKQSIFQTGIAVTGVFFSPPHKERMEIEKNSLYFRQKRKGLPKGRSMGCVFKNPQGEFAGELIERCGLKGLKLGGAYVSEGHGNFIINEGGTSEDISRLIEAIRLNVQLKTGIELTEEIRYLPQRDT